jgi:hypothetical protein
MIHVITYDELRAALMAYLFDSETYDDGGNQ